MTSRFVNPIIKYTTATLKTMPGAELYFYITGTTTPKTTYQDFEGTTPHSNPVVALSDGHFPPIFLDGTYRAELKYLGVTQPGWPVDDIGATDAPAPLADWNSGFSYSTGQLVTGPDGNRYQSLQDNNLNNEPSASPLYWSQVFLGGNVDSWEQLDDAARSGPGPKADAESAIRYSLDLPEPNQQSFVQGQGDGTYTNRTIVQTRSDLDISTVTSAAFSNKVTGPATAIDGAVALFDGAGGKLIKLGSSMASYLSNFLSTLYSIFPRTVNDFSSLSTITATAGDVVRVKGISTQGQKSQLYMAYSGAIEEEEYGSLIYSATPSVYFKKLGVTNDYLFNLTQPNFDRSYLANVNAINYDKNIMLFGDSHGWGQGSPEWDSYSNAISAQPHSASLFNRGFMARIEEYINEKRGYDNRIYTIAPGVLTLGLRVLPSDSCAEQSDYLVCPMKVISGRVIAESVNYATGTLKGWFTPFAYGDTSLIDVHRDKIFKGRFNKAAFNIYPETELNFLESGKNEYITLLPLPGVAASGGGFTTVTTDSNGTVLAEGDGAQFYIRVSNKTPAAEMGFFSSSPQSLFIPGYGKIVSGGGTPIGGATGRSIRIYASDGASYPTGLDKYVFANMRIFKESYVKNTTVIAEPKEPFRKIYISVYMHPAGRKISIGLASIGTRGGAAWNPNGHLSNMADWSLRPQWNWGQTGFPAVTMINSGGSRSAAPAAAITAIGSGSAVVIDTYAAVATDVVFEIDLGSKCKSEIYVSDYSTSASGTSLYSTVRGVLLDNNNVTNWSMGGHTIGNWMGIGPSFNDAAHDHLGDILAYSKANAYCVITELPLVNEYLRQTSIVDFKANIATFIQRINDNLNPSAPTRKTEFLFFTTIGHMDGEFEGTAYPAISYQDYSNAAKEQCIASGVGFLDVRQYVKDMARDGLIDYRLLYSDNIHPSGVCNEIYLRLLLPVIDQIL